jgi:hypothetical protein
MSRYLPETNQSAYDLSPDQRLCLHRLNAFGFPLGLLLMKARFRALAKIAESPGHDDNARVGGKIGYSEAFSARAADHP